MRYLTKKEDSSMLRKNLFAYVLLLLLAVPLGFKSYEAHAASDQQIQELKQMIEQNRREIEESRRQNELLTRKIEQLEG